MVSPLSLIAGARPAERARRAARELETELSRVSAALAFAGAHPNACKLPDNATNRPPTNTTTFTSTSTSTAQAAMPRRSRSLVDDAKLDTLRNRQLIEEIRREQQLRASMEVPDEEAEEELLGAGAGTAGLPPSGDAPDKRRRSDAVALSPTSPPATAGPTAADEDDEAKQAERYLHDFPRHISDLDHCNHLLIKYEPELDPTHPGFHDPEYRQRRKEVAEVAFNYKHGERIPDINYSDKERATWRQIYLRLRESYAKYACRQHNLAIEQLEAEQVYSPDQIPQLQQVSEFLERRTGWRLRPVAGLLSARDFLASLAFRVFQTTQYIRHWGNPEHSVEPDCIHELMGHIPMLCDSEFAQFSQELGLASLGATDEQIEKFATLYWFTVEFGICQEAGQLKCYGAGLLSSYGEMEHALESGKPKLKEFIPEETALETYDDSEYQVVYYVAKSFEDAKSKMREYAANNLSRRHELAYDPYTCTIRELSSYEQLESYTNSIKSDLSRLSAAIGRLKMAQAVPAAAVGRAAGAQDEADALLAARPQKAPPAPAVPGG
jgi:tyrosine 3-monooxygenase